MNTRNATIKDAAVIANFVCTLANKHIASSLGDGNVEILLASMNADATRRRIVDGWPHVCAFDENGLIGVIVVKPPTHLYHLFVATDLHRTGVGRNLFEIADKWSLSTNGNPLGTVNASLNVVAVYDRFGFEPDGPIVEGDGVRYQPMVRRNAG